MKNNSNEKLRPFYKWKDGFIDNYLKYCSPDSIQRRAKKVRVPHQHESADKSLGSLGKMVPQKSYLEGYFDSNAVISSSKDALHDDAIKNQSAE